MQKFSESRLPIIMFPLGRHRKQLFATICTEIVSNLLALQVRLSTLNCNQLPKQPPHTIQVLKNANFSDNSTQGVRGPKMCLSLGRQLNHDWAVPPWKRQIEGTCWSTYSQLNLGEGFIANCPTKVTKHFLPQEADTAGCHVSSRQVCPRRKKN